MWKLAWIPHFWGKEVTKRGRELQREQRETVGRAKSRCIEEAERWVNRRFVAFSFESWWRREMWKKTTRWEFAQGFWPGKGVLCFQWDDLVQHKLLQNHLAWCFKKQIFLSDLDFPVWEILFSDLREHLRECASRCPQKEKSNFPPPPYCQQEVLVQENGI